MARLVSYATATIFRTLLISLSLLRLILFFLFHVSFLHSPNIPSHSSIPLREIDGVCISSCHGAFTSLYTTDSSARKYSHPLSHLRSRHRNPPTYCCIHASDAPEHDNLPSHFDSLRSRIFAPILTAITVRHNFFALKRLFRRRKPFPSALSHLN